MGLQAVPGAIDPGGETPVDRGLWFGARLARALLTTPIRAYQLTLSRLLPTVCRFSPSCSQYAIEAIQLHGAVRGIPMAVWRIVRCNPLCQGGYDPVPPLPRRDKGPREPTG